MKVTTERVPDSQAVLQIEVEQERVEKSMDRAYRKMVGRYRIPGFRPGKAPRVMFERYVGRQTILREALENLVPEVYDEAVKQESLDPIGQPEFDIPSFEPLTIKATVPLRPTVELGDYRAMRIEPPQPAVEPEAIERTLEELQHRYATVEPVERPVEAGDVVRASVRATVDGEEVFNDEEVDLRLNEAGMRGLPGLQEKLVGTEKGQEYDYTVEVPAEDEGSTFAGKTVEYHVSIVEVKAERLPALDDAFASEVGEGFANVAALRERIESDLRRRAEEDAKREFDQKIVQTLMDNATLEYPPVMVDNEVDHVINEQFGGINRATLEQMLSRSGRTFADFREQFRDAAVERVKRSLVLSHVAESEGLTVVHQEVDDEIDRMVAEGQTEQAEQMRQMFGTESGHELIERTLLTQKVYERLRDVVQGKEVPPLAPRERPEAPEEAAEASEEAGPRAEAASEEQAEAAGQEQQVDEAAGEGAAEGATEAAQE